MRVTQVVLGVCLVLAALLWGGPCRALGADLPELYEHSGAGDLYDALDQDTQDLLAQMGGQEGYWDGTGGEGAWEAFSRLFREKLTAPLQALGALVAVVVLSSLAGSLEEGEGAVTLAATLCCAGVLAAPLLELIRLTGQVVDGACAFLGASVPVYGALLAASGSAAAVGSYSFLTLGAGAAIPVVCASLVIPLLHGFLLLALTSALCGGRFNRLMESAYGFAKWALAFAAALFSGILSVQTVLGAQVDAAAGKTMKLLASSAIPIVGGAFGDAVAALQNSVRVVKSGVGAFGVLAALCIFGPPALQAALWMGVCLLGQVAADLFEAPRLGSLFGACGLAAKMVLAVLASVCAVAVVAAALVLFVKGSL